MFDPRSPYHRRRWHYESDQPLSVAQLIAAGSVDARTAALIWVIVERHRSLIVSGPTDPTPGVGKTTTLNALLEFLPVGTTLVYTMGMYEDFDFLADTNAATTCVLANEVSDHLPIYMWGRVARKLLTLPASGFAVATSCHADTIDDVLRMLRRDLRLDPEDLSRLGLIVNIGLVGRVWPLRRRFLTVHYLRSRDLAPLDSQPTDAVREVLRTSKGPSDRMELLRLATWQPQSDDLAFADDATLRQLAPCLGLTLPELTVAVERRTRCLDVLAKGQGAGIRPTREAIEQVMDEEAEQASRAVRADDQEAEDAE
jgi:hypothetical protein